jgi:hypothetical protein
MSIRSRDIVMLERELTGNVHPKLMKALVNILEDHAAMKQQIMQLAGLFDQLINNQIAQAKAVNQMRSLAPLLQRMKAAGTEVGSDPTITGEINER